MKPENKKNRSIKPLIIFGIIFILITAIIALFYSSSFNIFPYIISKTEQSQKSEDFPEIDVSDLSSTQIQIVDLLKIEYQAQPDGTKYSNGIKEPWCADFVSWIMNQAGVPLNNPNSGSWRIPGTYTLREYYESIGRFKSGDSGYQPKVGDIMLYDNPSPFGQHTNIVIKNFNGVVTTVGGNEYGKIRVFTHKTPDTTGFIGYGLLE